MEGLKHKKPLTFSDFKYIYSKVPRSTVEVLIIKDGAVLLAKRSIDPYKGMWHSPGGTVYFREKITDAVKRVAKEEIGVDVEVGELLGIIEYDSEKDEYFGNSLSHVYFCKIVRGTPMAEEQSEEIAFFKEIPDNTIPEQREFYRQLLESPSSPTS